MVEVKNNRLKTWRIEDYCSKYYSRSYSCLTTTFKVLDDVLNGFYSSGLVLIAGRPAMRSTELVYAMIGNWIEDGDNVLMFSSSGNIDAPFTNIISGWSHVSYGKLTLGGGGLTQDEFDRYKKAFERFNECEGRLFMEYSDNSLHFDEIYEKSIKYVREKGVRAIIIDDFRNIYYQEREAYKDLALHLKRLALQLDVVIIVNMVLSSPGRDHSLIPKLNDLGKSETQNEWDVYGDMILGLSSAVVEQQRDHGANWDCWQRINVEILKNNFGREGDVVELQYNGATKVIYSVDG